MTRRTILLVEDKERDVKLVLRTLGKVNLANTVHVVRDGQQALDYLLETDAGADGDGHELPAVVLLDISLPRMSGLEVLQRLREQPRTRLLPVVILTSSDEDRDRLAAYRDGANSFVRKPLDFAEFTEKVAALGVYWFATNEPPPDPT